MKSEFGQAIIEIIIGSCLALLILLTMLFTGEYMFHDLQWARVKRLCDEQNVIQAGSKYYQCRSEK